MPTWTEFDGLPYREIVIITALNNVYEIVKAFRAGAPPQDVLTAYAQLVKDGVVGKDI